MPIIPELERQRQEDLNEFESSLLYISISRIVRTTKRDPVSENETK